MRVVARLEADGAALDARANDGRAEVARREQEDPRIAASANLIIGFEAYSTSTPVELNLEDCVASGNGTGIFAGGSGGTSTIRVSNCMVTANVFGVSYSGAGSMLTRGNNTVEGNNTNGSFSGTYLAK